MKWNQVFGGEVVTRPARKVVPVNHVAFVVDESGSMDHLKSAVVGAFTEVFRTVTEASKDQDTLVSLFKVNGTVRTEFVNEEPQRAALRSYNPGGMTPLNDGIGDAIRHLERQPSTGDVSYLVVVFTDGLENCSRRFTTTQIRQMIQDHQAKGNWTFVFQVPPGTSRSFLRNYGIEEGNTTEWQPTEIGTRTVGAQTQAGTQHYFQQRQVGARAVSTFYTDLAGVSGSAVRSSLNDLSYRFKSVLVPRETEIRPFVEATTGRPYSIGSTYYQLTKPEYVQANKNILLQEKGKKAVWGGSEARSLIGLPAHADVKVNPGNHANYDLFVQSTSTNRKLVRGTRIFIEQ